MVCLSSEPRHFLDVELNIELQRKTRRRQANIKKYI
jgi:hypothetical protein